MKAKLIPWPRINSSSAQLVVTPQELDNKSASVSKLSGVMKNEFDNLRNVINRSSSYWTGAGGDSHRSKFNEQCPDVDEMFRRIQEHVVDLRTMAGVYVQAEEAIKSEIHDSLPSDVIV